MKYFLISIFTNVLNKVIFKMEEMDLEEWNEQLKINPEGFMFELKCKKCNSKDVILTGYDNLGVGSEYTGIYGDAGFIIKCKSCGNAYKIATTDS